MRGGGRPGCCWFAVTASLYRRMLNYAALRYVFAVSSHASQILRFGVFEADLSTGELRKTARKFAFRSSHFRFWHFCWCVPANWSPGRICATNSGPTIPSSTSTTASIPQSTSCARPWAIRHPVRVLWKLCARRGYRFLATVETSQPASVVNG